jgi:hypothetical protein
MVEHSGSRRSLLRTLLVGVAQGIAILALTLALGELVARFVFGVRPLETEALVWEPHPRWGWFHKPAAEAVFVKPGFSQHIRINSKGLRERELPYEKAPGARRVLVIGDSSVVSFEVPPEAAFPRVAEDLLRARGYDVEFVNGGVRGYGTDQALLFLRDEGLRYAPDLVLYKWTDNDRDDNATVHRPFRRFAKPYFDVAQDGALTLHGTPVPEYPYAANVRVAADGRARELPIPLSIRATLWFRDVALCRSAFATGLLKIAMGAPELGRSLVGIGSYNDARDVSEAPDPSNRLFRATVEMVREMERVSRAAGAEFRMIGTAGPWGRAVREAAGLPDLGDLARFHARVPEGATLFVPYDPHLNELGHRLYAEAVSESLEAAGLLGGARAAGAGGAAPRASGGLQPTGDPAAG